MSTTCDVVVVGGGPAGAAAASRLAMLGYRIVLVAGRPSRRARLVHHLPPTIAPLLAAIGAPNAVGDSGGIAVARRLVTWGAPQPVVVEDRPPGALVDRVRFDAILVEAARERGAVIWAGHTVEHARHRSTGGWDLWLSNDGDDREISARSLVDASGGRLALGERRARWAPSTTALHGRWPVARDMPEIVTAAHGWLWAASSVVVDGGQALVVLFVDSRSLVGLSARDRRFRYAEVVRRSLGLGAAVEPSSIGSCDATPMWSRQPAGPDLVRVGDAALTLDPLSSDGVRSAVQSALHGVSALHTMATRPQDGHLSARFLEDATRRALRHNRRLTAVHYATGGTSDFYSARTEPAASPTDAALPGKRFPLQPDDLVRWSSRAHFAHVPSLVGDLIESRPALHHPSLDDPIVMLGNRPASDLRAAIDGRVTAARVIDLLRAGGWGDHAASVLATLHSLGVLQSTRARPARYGDARASA